MSRLVLFALATSASAGPATADGLRQLVGTWSIEERVPDGQVNRGTEVWTEPVPGLQFVQAFELESNEGSYSGQAVLWEAKPGSWAGIWCSQDEGCFGLRATVEAGALVVTSDRKPDGTHQRETITIGSVRMVRKLDRCTGQRCEPVSEIRGTRQNRRRDRAKRFRSAASAARCDSRGWARSGWWSG